MQEHVKRMVVEFNQLQERMLNLSAFLKRIVVPEAIPPGMDDEDLRLLNIQLDEMLCYRTTLWKRLERAGVTVDVESGKPHPIDQELTFGMKLVGLDFNPSGDPRVTELKQLAARMADIVNEHNSAGITPESGYLNSTFKGGAIRRILDGQMWAVKHITNRH